MAVSAPGMHFREGISLIKLFEMFPDDKAVEAWFIRTRWPDGMGCPRCGSTNVNDKAKHKTMPFRCRDCDKRFSPKTETIMACSKLGYQIWAIAIFLYTTSLKGVSSMKMHRDLNVTQRTAWYLLHRIRHSMSDDEQTLFEGPVEVDEIYVGGRDYNRHVADRQPGRGTRGKIPVVGVKDRETKQVQAVVMPEVDTETMSEFVSDRVDEGAKVYTAGPRVYDELWVAGFDHDIVYHSQREYVRGPIHTNGIESFWSGIKRGIMGVYHKVSPKHLCRYVAEFVAKQNMRVQDTIDQMKEIVQRFEGRRLRYTELIA